MRSTRELSILLVEDDQLDVRTVKRAFRENNMTNPLHVASDGVEALQMLRSGQLAPDNLLLLLDLNLPRMDGLELLRELRADAHLRRLPVVVLTTSADENDRVTAFDLNVAGYIIKPVTFAAFVLAMATLGKYWSLVELP
ncbi:MAG: response regulator [Myxococcales bacterium]|nr:response regulator [Myxococcales bacterium]